MLVSSIAVRWSVRTFICSRVSRGVRTLFAAMLIGVCVHFCNVSRGVRTFICCNVSRGVRTFICSGVSRDVQSVSRDV